MADTSLQQRFDQIVWRSDADAEFAGLDFYFETTLAKAPPPGKVYVFKPKYLLQRYVDVFGASPTRNVLELGIWLGGSALALAALFDVRKLVAVDICPPVAPFDAIRATHPLGQRIAAHYHTSQDDEAKLSAILDTEFDTPLDIVIDDASHFYGPSRRSFEILFPWLQPGGWYVIEDWGWAHLDQPLWMDEPSLAGLIFEIQLAWLCNPNLIGKVVVHREMVFIQKADGAPVSRTPLVLDNLYVRHHRSRPLVE